MEDFCYGLITGLLIAYFGVILYLCDYEGDMKRYNRVELNGVMYILKQAKLEEV